MNERDEVMGNGKILPTLLKFSIPATIGMVVNSLYNVVDRIFVGKGVGEMGIAATTAVNPVAFIIMALSILGGMGCSTLVAIHLGEQKADEAESVLNHTIRFIIVVALLTSLLGVIFINPLLKVFGATEDVMEYARQYGLIIIGFSSFNYVSFGLNHTIRSLGNPKTAMSTMIIGGVINIILDYLFVMVFGWGVAGAAWATIIGQVVSTIWVISYFMRPKVAIHFKIKGFKFNFGKMLEIIKIGSSQAIMQFINGIIMSILNHAVVAYGNSVSLAATGIYNSINTLAILPIVGISQGAQPLMGYNFGADKKDRLIKFYRTAVIIASAVVLVIFIAIYIYSIPLAGIFIDKNNSSPEVIELTSKWLKIGLSMIFTAGFVIVSTGYFQSIGNPKKALILSLSRQVIFYIPILLILPKFMKITGVMLAQPISDFMAFLTAICLIIYEMKKLKGAKAHER